MCSVKGLFGILGFLLAFQSSLFAQRKIDSLLQRLQTNSKTELLQTHLELSIEYIDPSKAKHHAKLAYSITEEIGDSINMVEAGRLLAFSYRDLNHLDSSIYIYNLVLPIAKRNGLLVEYGRLLNGMGITCTLLAAYDEALEHHLESLAVMEKLGNQKRIAMSLFNIGFVYYKIKDYQKSLDYYDRAKKIKHDIQDNFQLDLLFINTGLSYAELANYEAAKGCIDTALSVCNGECSDFIKTQAEYARGLVFFKLKDNKKAEHHFLQSYILAKQTGDSRMQFDNIVFLSDIYCGAGKSSTAEKYLKEAESLIPNMPYNLEVIKLYKELFTLYEKTGDLKRMAFYQGKYIHVKDSVYNENFTNNLMRVQAEYLERENKVRIAAQQQMINLKDEIIVRQNWLTVLAGIAAVLLIVVVYILYKSNKQRKMANRLLDGKIAQRVAELKSNYGDLQIKLEERKLAYTKTVAGIRNSVDTLKDLSSSSINGSNENINQAREMDAVIEKLSEILRAHTERKQVGDLD